MSFLGGGRIRSFALLFSDMFCLGASVLGVCCLCKLWDDELSVFIIWRIWPVMVLLLLFNLSGRLYCGNLLHPGLVINPVEELRRLTLSCLGSFLVFFAISNVISNSDTLHKLLLPSALLSVVLLPFGRIMIRYLLWKLKAGKIPALLVGDAELAQQAFTKMTEDNFCILSVQASCCGKKISDDLPDLGTRKLMEFAAKNKINYLIYCNKNSEYKRDVEKFLPSFAHVLIVNQTARFPVLWSYPVSFYRYFAFEISNRLLRKEVLFQKRVLEILLALIGTMIAFLPMIILALLVKLSSKGPIFYRAKRLGQHGKPIAVLKFRTMYADADKQLEDLLAKNPKLREEWDRNFKLENDPRITPIGNFLRRTSLDELPQFWNVIKGEMALIGPRPIVKKEIPYYGQDYKIFSSVKPGITGLWQVSGRNNVDYEDRVAMDIFYVNNWSIWMDFYIFLATFNAVILRRGAK